MIQCTKIKEVFKYFIFKIFSDTRSGHIEYVRICIRCNNSGIWPFNRKFFIPKKEKKEILVSIPPVQFLVRENFLHLLLPK